MVNKTGLYLHIPFCVRKCRYCDFLSFPADEDIRERYVQMLAEEIRQKGRMSDRAQDCGERGERRLVSVFLGGGTPSVLTGKQIKTLMEAVRSSFSLEEDAEITMECNPGTADLQKLHAFRECGINRLSVGVQSSDDAELQLLGRIHTWDDAVRCFEEARTCGFENLSADLISSLPGQTPERWRNNLKKVLTLKPKHLSAYSLIIEEGTPFYERYHEDDLRRERGEQPSELPDEETDRAMYRMTEELLVQAGMRRYEISNYAVPGYESVHNCGYWERREYIGCGLGAASQTDGRRYRNTDQMKEYLAGDFGRREEQILSCRDELEESFFLGLRMMKGVDLDRLSLKYKELLAEYEPVLDRLSALGLIRRSGSFIALTRDGIDISNYVFSELLLDDESDA